MWTTRSMAWASLAVTMSWVNCGPASMAHVVSFRIAPMASRAWVVDSEPDPFSIVLSIAITSGPRGLSAEK